MWFTFPNTKGLPLEEVAAIFGDKGQFEPRNLSNLWQGVLLLTRTL